MQMHVIAKRTLARPRLPPADSCGAASAGAPMTAAVARGAGGGTAASFTSPSAAFWRLEFGALAPSPSAAAASVAAAKSAAVARFLPRCLVCALGATDAGAAAAWVPLLGSLAAPSVFIEPAAEGRVQPLN